MGMSLFGIFIVGENKRDRVLICGNIEIASELLRRPYGLMGKRTYLHDEDPKLSPWHLH